MKSNEKRKMKVAWCVLALVVLICPVQVFGAVSTQENERYLYDAQGRLTRVTHADGSNITYAYDKNGNLLSIAAARLQAKAALGAPTVTIAIEEQIPSGGVAPPVPDPDPGETRTFSIVTQPANGAASVVNNQLVYTPKAGFHGSDSFTFRATDRVGASVDGAAEVTVKPKTGVPGVIKDAAPKAEGAPSASPFGAPLQKV